MSLEAPVWSAAQGARSNDLRDVERLLLDAPGRGGGEQGRRSARTDPLECRSRDCHLPVRLDGDLRRPGVQRPWAPSPSAAERVRSSRDFSVRARRASNDELGMLTETFNEMLAGMQSRDARARTAPLPSRAARRRAYRGARGANSAMRLVLDNVEQGLATIGVDGSLHSERSAAFDRGFGAARDGGTVLRRPRSGRGAPAPPHEARMGAGRRGFLPPEVSVEQLPKRFDLGGRHFTLTVQPILRGDDVAGALLVVSDVTAELEAREGAGAPEGRDPGVPADCRRQARVRRLPRGDRQHGRPPRGGDPLGARGTARHRPHREGQRRAVRRALGRRGRPRPRIRASRTPAPRSTRRPFRRSSRPGRRLHDRVAGLLGTGESVVELSRGELERILARVAAGAPPSELAARLRMLFDEPVAMRFARLAEHVERLAARLGKPAPRLAVRAEDVRLPQRRYASFWAALVHVARNAIDHGIEDPAVRTAAGKPARGAISFNARLEDASVLIEVVDDGAGVDWERLAARARAAGLPARSREEIERTSSSRASRVSRP